MYVVNVIKHFDPQKLYKSNTFIRDWLIYYNHFSLLGMSEDGYYYFARTDALEKVLAELPLHLKIIENLSNLNKKIDKK